MKNVLYFIGLFFLLNSCDLTMEYHRGNGNVVKENRDVPAFHAVKTSGSIDVEIIPSQDFSVVVENDENLLEYVVTEVNNGVLEVRYKSGNYSNDQVKVFAGAPSLNEITSSGNADIDIRGTLKNEDEIRFRSSGSGDISGEVDAPSVKFSGSGSGDIKLSGRTQNFACEVRGSGDVKCQDLKSENADIKVSGSSNVNVFASVNLKVSVSGSGDVIYSGNPSNPEIKIRGSGEVKAK